MIEFYYSIKDIIHRAQTETLLFTQNIEREDTGIAAIDEFAISDADISYVKTQLLETASNRIFSLFVPYTNWFYKQDPVHEPFIFDEAFTKNGSTIQDAIVYKMIAPVNFMRGIIKPLDNAIRNAMVYFCVAEFLKRNNGNYPVFMELYEKELFLIMDYLSRRSIIKRHYKLY